jgi:hypothetical protein
MTMRKDASPATPPSDVVDPSAAPVPMMKFPPPTMNIPAPPQGFVPLNGADFRSVVPKISELLVLKDAVEELENCPDFDAMFGALLPQASDVIAAFDSAGQWPSARARMNAFDAYCTAAEGFAWVDLRKLMAKMQPYIEGAVDKNAELGERFNRLVRLLRAKKAIARNGVATREANREARARGEAPTRGAVAQAKKRAAEKAALAAQLAAKDTPSE